MSIITHVVSIFFSFDRTTWTLSPEWIKKRIKFFEAFTLKSLLNQSFQDFRIFLICGNRHRKITDAHQWHGKVELCYDNCQAKYAGINTDHVAITRIDSDDLFHKDALAEVRDSVILSNRRECLIFRKNLVWDVINRVIGRHYRQAPPFFTHIFPRRIFRNWPLFSQQHCLVHGQAGGRLPSTKELSEHKVCVVQHRDNISLIRRGLKPVMLSEEQRQALAVRYEWQILDRDRIVAILRDFGVEEGLIT